MRTKLLKTFVLSVAFGMVSCGLEDNLSEIAPEGDTGDATGGKSTGGAASTGKTGTGGSSKSSNATGGKASASAGGSDSDSGGVGGAKATGKSSTTRGSASTGGAKATGSGGASNADDTDGESGSNASPKGGSNGQRSSTTRTSKAGAGGTGIVSVPMGGAKSNSAGGAGNTSSNGGTTATSSGGSGNTGNGGASTGGSKAATGGAATGGAATGGAATGGAATGGAATGGSKAATGGVATGGVATGGVATGGKPATGGAATGGAPTTTSAPPITGSCSEGQKALTANGTGTHCGYTYEYWKDQGTGTLTLKADGFSVDWSNINNLLGRKGVRPGTGNEVVTYDANYQPNGNSYLCIYGWFKNPLVEYYIVDSWGTWRPPGGQGLQGTVTCDGATYDIYKLPRTGPSIEGDNTSFTQYFNVRQQKRTSGTINVGCHIASWKAKGMSVGSFYEVSMTVEGYQSSGKADVKFSMK